MLNNTLTKQKLVQIGDVIKIPQVGIEGIIENPNLFQKGRFNVAGPMKFRGHIDQEREKARYVVEKTYYGGGGTGHGPYDIYPDGWHVTARRLLQGDVYDPQGEIIEFYQTGCFLNKVETPDIVGKMQMMFVNEGGKK
ncbi:MAG: hypothetical protein PHH54_00710 [Candidatus Nanoarchaeia archaeon]|nr:hypothetical protein [Candidatus Nanoarchaeia archaeon]MDD5740483.1 hypothetical protein [Candidatus Nanoarchaeia archaeon]